MYKKLISKNIDALKKSVRIEIKNTQTVSGQTDTVVERADGTFVMLSGKKHLYYELSGEKHTLNVDDGCVRLIKRPSGSSLVFEKGREAVCDYLTPYGKIEMTTVTDTVTDKLADNGVLTLEYRLSVGGTEPVYNKMEIKIKEI